MAAANRRRAASVTALPAPSEPAPMLPGPLPTAPDPAVAFREAAQTHAAAALEALAELVKSANSEAVRVSAANALIDRAYGRAAQAVRVGGQTAGGMGGEDEGQISLTFTWLDPAKS
ncbi:MAG TPA: hypothetical protein VMU59_14065 [Caulobacteraceae bacterium]|nr:hypothetical protein [Caulobacteraceae bacterium]